MENKRYHTTPKWYEQCLEHCGAFGISKSIIQLFIHLQEQKYEQNNKET
ncbi:hypothetical protein ACIQ7N_11015 [Lysinibacillus sp. NPDC095746]